MCLSSDIPLENIWIDVYIIVLSAYKDIKLHICFILLLLLDIYYTYENNIPCFKENQCSVPNVLPFLYHQGSTASFTISVFSNQTSDLT